jgi:hypothetical protein
VQKGPHAHLKLIDSIRHISRANGLQWQDGTEQVTDNFLSNAFILHHWYLAGS